MKLGRFIILLCVTGCLAGCGYHLSGTGAFIPSHIRTVNIRQFDNQTTRYQADQFVTFAVRDEFIRRSHLKVVEKTEDADSLLEGEIVRFQVTPVSYAEETAANKYQVQIMLNVRLIDLRNNEIIFENKNLRYTDTYDIDSADFFSQETETLEKIAKSFAASVVTAILENF